MSNVTRLYLVRHGQSAGNAEGRFGGHGPTPLSDLGLSQAEKTARVLAKEGINAEVIDLRTVRPIDYKTLIESVKKTNRLVFLDEDVPGGATAYMMQQVMEHQDIFRYLDALPRTLSAKANRGAYGSDGDYFCKPGVEDVVELVYSIMHEADPASNPKL